MLKWLIFFLAFWILYFYLQQYLYSVVLLLLNDVITSFNVTQSTVTLNAPVTKVQQCGTNRIPVYLLWIRKSTWRAMSLPPPFMFIFKALRLVEAVNLSANPESQKIYTVYLDTTAAGLVRLWRDTLCHGRNSTQNQNRTQTEVIPPAKWNQTLQRTSLLSKAPNLTCYCSGSQERHLLVQIACRQHFFILLCCCFYPVFHAIG